MPLSLSHAVSVSNPATHEHREGSLSDICIVSIYLQLYGHCIGGFAGIVWWTVTCTPLSERHVPCQAIFGALVAPSFQRPLSNIESNSNSMCLEGISQYRSERDYKADACNLYKGSGLGEAAIVDNTPVPDSSLSPIGSIHEA